MDDPTKETVTRTDLSPRVRSQTMAGFSTSTQKLSPVGILRLDIGKPRRHSGSSVDFRNSPDELGPPSPQPSVDRLSVTFVTPEECSVFSPTSPPSTAMEKVRFSRETTVTDGEEDGDEDDYSASVCAIMQRRESTRRQSKRRRRPSSPFSPDRDSGALTSRRRSSAYTSSSGETAISMDDGMTQEQIHENLRLHKEVLSSVKFQPWGMRKKLRLVHQAKIYVKRHEGELQERLAQSKSTKDILARFNILLVKKWQYLKRELANIVNYMIPWELRIKEIESHFGSVVASYFTFLRWLFWVNLVICVLLIAFVSIPEMLTADKSTAGDRKNMLDEEKATATKLATLWNFEGVLKYSPIFYGFYTNSDDTKKGYRLPFAYFMTGLAVYIYSFVATLRRMAENSRMSKLSEKDDECIFTWKLFTGWDYMIGNAETAHNRTASVILGFKEALLEEAEKKRNSRNWKVIVLRVFVNLTVLMLLTASAYAVVEVVNRSTTESDSWWRQNEITIVMTFISFVFPIIFEVIGLLEGYHPRKQLRIQLARIMVLNLLNLYSLIFALFGNISDMTKRLAELNPNSSTIAPTIATTAQSVTPITSITTTTESTSIPTGANTICVPVPVECTTTEASANLQTSIMAAMLILNLTTGYPTSYLNNTNAITDVTKEMTKTTTTTTTKESSTIGNLSPDINFSNSNDIEKLNNYVDSSTESDTYTGYNTSSYVSNYTDYYESNDTYSETVNGTLIIPDTINISDTSDRFDFTFPWPDISNSVSNHIRTLIYGFLKPGIDKVTESDFGTDISPGDTTEGNTITSYTSTTDSIVETSTSTFATDTTENDITQEISEESRSTCYVTRCYTITTQSTSTSTTTTPVSTTTSSRATETSNYGGVTETISANASSGLDLKTRRELRRLCWETMFGQELVKLTVMDLVMTVISTLTMDFFRALFVRYMNRCWCWDLEKKFPQYGDFKIAENILHLVNNQGMVWMGMFFSPGLPLLNTIKLMIMMYLRSWAVLTCNVPHEVVFRASRSNNFYLALLLTMLFLCVLPVGYAIVWIKPSWHCGPFSKYSRIYHIFTQSILNVLPQSAHIVLDYIASPGIMIPLLVLLILIIYYLASLTASLREANNDLKIQLRRERTEERRKMFQLVTNKRRRGTAGGDSAETTFNRWRKILPVLPSSKTVDDNKDPEHSSDLGGVANGDIKSDTRNDFLAKFVKQLMRKSSATSDEDGGDKDFTDIELHDSLPEDGLGLLRSDTLDSTPDFRHQAEDDGHHQHHINHRSRWSVSKSRTPPTSFKNKEREDSITSSWSDGIPVIKISNIDSQDKTTQQAEPQTPVTPSSSDTVIEVDASTVEVQPETKEENIKKEKEGK